jgi:hypothetical protein
MILPLEAVTADRPQPPPVYDNPPAIARRRGWLARLASRNASGGVSGGPAPPAQPQIAG